MMMMMRCWIFFTHINLRLLLLHHFYIAYILLSYITPGLKYKYAVDNVATIRRLSPPVAI